MLGKIFTCLLAVICMISMASCNKYRDFHSNMDDRSHEDISSDDISNMEEVNFDESELVQDLNYKLLNIMNQSNYFDKYYDILLHELGDYTYRVYQDSEYSNHIYVIVNPDDKHPQIYSFTQLNGELKYAGLFADDYFSVVENEKIADGGFKYEELFTPVYDGNDIDYEGIAGHVKDSYDVKYNDSFKGSKIYFKNQFSWCLSSWVETYVKEAQSQLFDCFRVVIVKDNGDLHLSSIFSPNLDDAHKPIPESKRKWTLEPYEDGYKVGENSNEELWVIDRIIESSPYSFTIE